MFIFGEGVTFEIFKKSREKEGNDNLLKKERIGDGEGGGEDEESGGADEDRKDESPAKLETEEARRLIFSFKDISISCLGFQLS